MTKERSKVLVDLRLSSEEQAKIDDVTTIIYEIMEEMEKYEGDVALKITEYGEEHTVSLQELERAFTIFTFFENADDGEVAIEANSKM